MIRGQGFEKRDRFLRTKMCSMEVTYPVLPGSALHVCLPEDNFDQTTIIKAAQTDVKTELNEGDTRFYSQPT
jgi:hypothetical protein